MSDEENKNPISVERSTSYRKAYENSAIADEMHSLLDRTTPSGADSNAYRLHTDKFNANLIDFRSINTQHQHWPYEPKYFKKRVCYKSVDKNKYSKCDGCKESVIGGDHVFGAEEWSTETCTRLETTDAFGKIEFPGSYTKTANYIRIANDTSPGSMIQYLYHEKAWHLSMPQLIISVTGGAQNFTIPQRMKTAFKLGLIKAATSTNAWIITGGTNTGVMRLVGEAVSEEFNKLTVIGIATWGKVALRDKLINSKDNIGEKSKSPIVYSPDLDDKTKDVSLDPNHTHFILVDDGTNGEFGAEISFRAGLENELSKGKPLKEYMRQQQQEYTSLQHRNSTSLASPNDVNMDIIYGEKIPMILIVVQGGPNTLKTVAESIDNDVPVLILADSKGCADLIANACALTNPSDENLNKLINDSKMFINTKTKEIDTKRSAIALNHIKKILEKSSDLINVFRLDSDENSHDIELTILRAFLNSRRTEHYENLKLALKWNRSDIAKTEIFTGEEQFKKNQLQYLMELAIVENKSEFVDILLENRVNMISFLTHRRLLYIYNADKIKRSAKKSPLFQLLKIRFNKDYTLASRDDTIIHYEIIKKLFYYLGFGVFKIDILPENLDEYRLREFLLAANKIDSTNTSENESVIKFGKDEVGNPIENLFIWSLLLNRIELAKIFWQIGNYQMCNALFASALLKKIARCLPDRANELLKYADTFEDLAVGVLDTFDMNTDDWINGVILLRRCPYFNVSLLQMAVEADCKHFVAQPAVQNLLTYIWNGKLTPRTGLMTKAQYILNCFTFGIFAPVIAFRKGPRFSDLSDLDRSFRKEVNNLSDDDNDLLKEYLKESRINDSDSNSDDQSTASDGDEERLNSNNNSNNKNPIKLYLLRYKQFMNAPRVHFFYDSMSFTIFLVLFSYMMLCNFDYGEYVDVIKEITVSNETNSTIDFVVENVLRPHKPSWLQYLLIFWVFSMFCEEIRQFLVNVYDVEENIKMKIRYYLRDDWNYLDLLGCLIFAIGMSLRFCSFIREDPDLLAYARLVLCLDLCVWYVRLLHVSLVFKSLGPKLVMIRQMLRDLMFFISIIAIFVCLFGVITQSTMYPKNELDYNLFRNIIQKAYWPIYGEMKILDDDINHECTENSTEVCPDKLGVQFSFVALMVYMVIANVLLINLLIAMFSSTFQKVQENTDEIWKFQRYRLIFENKDLPFVPPPFCLIAHFVDILIFFKNLSRCSRNNKDEKNYESKDNDIILNHEKKYAELYLRCEKARQRELIDSRLRLNAERLDALERKLNEVNKSRESEMQQISTAINWVMSEIGDKLHADRVPFIGDELTSKRTVTRKQ